MSLPNEATPAFWQIVEQQADVNTAIDELTLKLLDAQLIINRHETRINTITEVLNAALETMHVMERRHLLLAKAVYGTDSSRN